MSGFSFGNAVIGLAQGQQQAQQLQAKRLQNQAMQQQLQDQKRQLDAAAAVLSGIGSGQAPQMQQVPMPGATAMPGAAPPVAAPPAAPAAPGMPPGGGAAPGPAAPPSPGMAGPPPAAMSGPAPQPGPAAGPAPAAAQAGGDPVSGVARPTGDFVQDSKNTFTSIATDIKRRNPGIDPATLLAATQKQIEVMRGLEPETRAYLDSQVKYAQLDERAKRDQQTYEAKIAKLEEDLQKTREQIAGRKDVAQLNADSRGKVAATAANAKVIAAQIGATSRETVADTNREGAMDRTQLAAKVKEDVANGEIDVKLAQADANYRRGVDAARVAAGMKPLFGSSGIQPRKPLQGGGGTSGKGAPPPEYKKAPDGYHYKKLPNGKFERWE